MKLRNLTIFLTFCVILIAHYVHVRSQEVEDEREFSYDSAAENGPHRWGAIHNDWEACGSGRLQSPIDLPGEKKVAVVAPHEPGKTRRTYRPSGATMINRGHDLMLKWADGAGGLRINGTEYLLKQLHWHSPSEHTLNGKSFTMELHMVHQSKDNGTAVVGILYEIGRPDPFLQQMEKYIHEVKNVENEEEFAGVVDPSILRRGSRKHYRYIGSLTTPPCTEDVAWTIMTKVRTVSREQVALLRQAVNDNMENNARPTQPMNGRAVHFYGTVNNYRRNLD